MTVSPPPVPQLPDPTVVAEALTTLMQNAAAAVRTTMVQAATPQALRKKLQAGGAKVEIAAG